MFLIKDHYVTKNNLIQNPSGQKKFGLTWLQILFYCVFYIIISICNNQKKKAINFLTILCPLLPLVFCLFLSSHVFIFDNFLTCAYCM